MKKIVTLILILSGFLFSCSNENKDDDPIPPFVSLLQVSDSILCFPFDGGVKEFSVISNSEWNIYNDSIWCTVDPVRGKGEQIIRLEVTPMEDSRDRNTTINIIDTTGKVVSIKVIQQRGDTILYINNENEGCLDSLLGGISLNQYQKIILSGNINQADIQALNTKNFLYLDLLGTNLTEVYSAAFQGNSLVKEILLPDGVINIRDRAFLGCRNLTSIKFPPKLSSIGSQAFENCINLKSINIPEGVTQLNHRSFKNCEKLECIDLPLTLESIGYSCFEGCENLLSIKIPNSVIFLQNDVFKACSKLTRVDLSRAITHIEMHCFEDCISLTSIELPTSLIYLAFGAFKNCSSLSSIIIPDKVRIEGQVFSECKKLTSVIIPEGITILEDKTFEGCI